MNRKFAVLTALLSLFSLSLVGCPKKAEPEQAIPPPSLSNSAPPVAAPAAETDPEKLTGALKAEAGLAGVKIQKNAKGELVMTGKVADQALKLKADELVKAAGGTVKNAIIVGK